MNFKQNIHLCVKGVLIVLVKETTCNKECKQLNLIKYQTCYCYCTAHNQCMGSVFSEALHQGAIANVLGGSCSGDGNYSKEDK